MFYAALEGYPKVMQFLIDHGAGAKGNLGQGHENVVAFLLGKGVNPHTLEARTAFLKLATLMTEARQAQGTYKDDGVRWRLVY